MTSIRASARAYEAWLRAQLGEDLVEADLEKKYRLMRAGGAFPFLRASYWRWSETILEIRPEIAEAPRVLSIGDTHLENFGTWRDTEGRLIWGTNDFDEAAIMPWPLDLLRLAVSALLADVPGTTAEAVAAALLEGYAAGLAHPQPVVLECEHTWLREAVLLPEAKRPKFWAKMKALEPGRVRRRYRNALRAAMPDPDMALSFAPRQAGLGSLGRPRFVAHGSWRGGPILREAKALLISAWARRHARRGSPIRAGEIAGGRHRAPDPHYRVLDDILVRRLSPNSRKLEVEDAVDAALLVCRRMLALMGREVAACHADDRRRLPALEADLRQRDPGWLAAAAVAVAAQVTEDQKEFARLGR